MPEPCYHGSLTWTGHRNLYFCTDCEIPLTVSLADPKDQETINLLLSPGEEE